MVISLGCLFSPPMAHKAKMVNVQQYNILNKIFSRLQPATSPTDATKSHTLNLNLSDWQINK